MATDHLALVEVASCCSCPTSLSRASSSSSSSHGVAVPASPPPRVQGLPRLLQVQAALLPLTTRRSQGKPKPRALMAAAAAAAKEKVFVALPAEARAGRSTLEWALGRFGGGGATIVIAHVHVPPQMIPVMGVKFHASKLSLEQVSLFRSFEREKVNTLLDSYVHQCLKMKVKCQKLIIEKDDVVAGLLELITIHGITDLVISAAADKNCIRKMNKPKSRTATEIMQRADPSCKIWFVCKEQLICTRDKEVEITSAVTPLLPNLDHGVLSFSPHQEEESELELGFYDELKEACKAAENLMNRTFEESSRRQKAEEEVASSLQKAKEYEDLYLEEVNKRKELEGTLVRTTREIAQLRQATHPPKKQQNMTMEELQEAIAKKLILEQRIVDMNADSGAAGQLIQPQPQLDHDNGSIKLEAFLNQRKLAVFSPSSVMQSPFDEDHVPSYFVCPIFQEVMREPCIAADGFTYEADAIRGWLDGGHDVSPMTSQPLEHRELTLNLALRSAIKDYMRRQEYPSP